MIAVFLTHYYQLLLFGSPYGQQPTLTARMP